MHAKCPTCEGRGLTTYKPAERLHNDDRGEWTCSTCRGQGTVPVEPAPPAPVPVAPEGDGERWWLVIDPDGAAEVFDREPRTMGLTALSGCRIVEVAPASAAVPVPGGERVTLYNHKFYAPDGGGLGCTSSTCACRNNESNTYDTECPEGADTNAEYARRLRAAGATITHPAPPAPPAPEDDGAERIGPNGERYTRLPDGSLVVEGDHSPIEPAPVDDAGGEAGGLYSFDTPLEAVAAALLIENASPDAVLTRIQAAGFDVVRPVAPPQHVGGDAEGGDAAASDAEGLAPPMICSRCVGQENVRCTNCGAVACDHRGDRSAEDDDWLCLYCALAEARRLAAEPAPVGGDALAEVRAEIKADWHRLGLSGVLALLDRLAATPEAEGERVLMLRRPGFGAGGSWARVHDDYPPSSRGHYELRWATLDPAPASAEGGETTEDGR